MMNCKRPLEIEQVNISNDLQTLSNKKQRMHSESNVSKVNGKDQTSSTCIGNLIIDNVTRLREMTDSTLLYQTGQYDKLKLILDTDGYLLIRKVIPEPTALKARNKILFHLKQKNAINIEHDDYMKGMIAIDKRTGKLHEGWTIDAESGG